MKAKLLALVEPGPGVVGEEERRRARMLAGILVLMIPAGLFSVLVTQAALVLGGKGPGYPMAAMGVGACTFGLFLYKLSRGPHHRPAAFVAIAIAVLAVWSSVVLQQGTPEAASAPWFLALPIILSSFVLPLAATLAVAALLAASVVAVPLALPGLAVFDAVGVLLLMLFVSGPIAVFSALRHRDVLRIEAQAHSLEKSEAELRAVMGTAPSIILTVDHAGVIRYVNRTVIGTPETVVGTSMYDYVPPEERARLRGILDRVFTTQRAESYEVRALAANGAYAWYGSRIGPVVEGGKVVGATIVTSDISELKAVQEEAAQSAARAGEIHRLEDIARFKSDFINMAAHELGTPMTPIRTHVYMLRKRRDLDGEARASVEAIERNVRWMSELLRDVLDGARIQAGRLDVRRRPMALDAPLREVLASYAGVAAEAGLALASDLEPDLEVDGDPTRLAQVASNLLSNAVKFTPRGGRVDVVLRHAGGEAVLTVRDSGQGLTQEQMDRLFQPFGQAHEPHEGPIRGTGLGLWISREIAERHGGTLTCASDGPGRGATFTLRLPLLPSPRPARVSPA